MKRWAQYELIDKGVVKKIIDALELVPEDTVLEIGAGTGVLTFPLREKAAKVIAVEIDKTAPVPDTVNIDFLKMDLSPFPPSVKVVSNLPYYITTPIITKVIPRFDLIVFTMQEEVAERLAASPGTKDYGSISVFVQFYTVPEIVCRVPRRCFRPVPKVDSCIVRFRRRRVPIDFPEDYLFKIVRKGFSSRRKMLRNTLGVSGETGARRPETLGVEEFCSLAGDLWRRQQE